jgi:hypothetical protein
MPAPQGISREVQHVALRYLFRGVVQGAMSDTLKR